MVLDFAIIVRLEGDTLEKESKIRHDVRARRAVC